MAYPSRHSANKGNEKRQLQDLFAVVSGIFYNAGLGSNSGFLNCPFTNCGG
jgi:hypothetical protein